jgi:hypothetical protein
VQWPRTAEIGSWKGAYNLASALTQAVREEAHVGTSHQRTDAEQAVRDTPGLPEEAILAEMALTEDRTLDDE